MFSHIFKRGVFSPHLGLTPQNFNAIRSKNHQVYSINQSKVGLTSYDNKRYWFNDTDSLPYGHYSLSNYIIILLNNNIINCSYQTPITEL